MNLAQLRQFCYHDLGYDANPGSKVEQKFTDWLNMGHRIVLREPGMVDLRFITLPFTSVAGIGTYGLPQAFEVINAVVQTSSQRRLRYMSRDRFRTYDPGETSTGIPDFWIPGGLQPVNLQPPVAGTGVWVASSSGSDITQKVAFQGIRLNGDIQIETQVSLSGTSRIPIQSTFTDFVQVLLWNLDSACQGDVSLYTASVGGTQLGRIPAGQTSVQYQSVRLWPTPSSVLSFNIDGRAEIADLVLPTDVPLVPPSYHDILINYAKMREYETKQDSRYPIAQQEFQTYFQELRASVQYPPDYRPIAGSRQGVGVLWPNLAGGYYQADYEWP